MLKQNFLSQGWVSVLSLLRDYQRIYSATGLRIVETSMVTDYTLDAFPNKVLRTDRKQLLPSIHLNRTSMISISPPTYISKPAHTNSKKTE